MTLRPKRHFKAYLLLGYAFLLLVHFVIKDHIFPISIIFYAAPIPILLVIGLLLLLLCYQKRSYAFGLVAILGFLTYHWHSEYYYTHQPTASNTPSGILYWNLAKKKQLPVTYISEKAATYQPNVLAFVEATASTLSNLDELQKALPNYQFKRLDGAMLVAAQGDISLTNFIYKQDAYKVNVLNISTNTHDFNIALTDLTANVFVDKQTLLPYVLNIANDYRLDIILGDFNTPYESVYFSPYHENFSSFHETTNGFTATWPFGIPLLELDHVWLSKKHKIGRLHKFYNAYSDHALLIAAFEFDGH